MKLFNKKPKKQNVKDPITKDQNTPAKKSASDNMKPASGSTKSASGSKQSISGNKKPASGSLTSLGRYILFPVILFLVQMIFFLIALYAGKGSVYLKVAAPVWILVVFLYTVAVWLTRNARTRRYSSSALLIVIFSGFLMAIGCLNQVVMIGHLTMENNASKYILYQVYEYAAGEEASDVLHTTGKEYKNGTIDTFISEGEAQSIISTCEENGLTFTTSKGEEITANYEITASEAKKAMTLLSECESFPAYDNILEAETSLRENKEARSLGSNYVLALAAGLIVTLILLFMHGHYFDYWIPWLTALEGGFFLLLLLFGTGSDGAHINLGPLQPLEFMKFIYILVLADLLCKPEKADASFMIRLPKNHVMVINRYIAALAFIVFNALGFMACGELGTLLIIGCVGLCMILIFCDRFWYRAGTMIACAGGLLLLFVMAHFKITYLGRKLYNRFHFFFAPGEDPNGLGYQYTQLRQSLAISGWFGAKERYAFHISQEDNDMVFNALVQARGIIFGLLVIALFMGLLLVAYRAALRASDVYYRGLGLACCLLLGFQGLIHIAYNVGAFPITGVPLMYISEGGSNMAISMIMTVLLIVISSNHLVRAASDEEEIDELMTKNQTKSSIKRLVLNFTGTLKRSFSMGWIR